MIMRLFAGLALSVILSAGSPAQVGPLPGMAVLSPPMASGGGCGTPAVTNVGVNNNTSGATLAVSGVTVPAGSLIIVIVGENSLSAASGAVADGANTYTLGPTSTVVASPLTSGSIFFAPNASLSGGTITYTKGSSGVAAGMSVVYISSIATSSPLDGAVSNSAGNQSSAPSVTSGTPAQSGEAFVGALIVGGTATITQDSGNGWSSPPNFSAGSVQAGGGFQVNSGTGTKTYAPSLSVSSPWVDLIAGFKHC